MTGSRTKLSIAALAVCALFALSTLARAGDITGKALFEGDKRPRRKQIKMAADPKCKAMHDKPVGTEDIIVNSKTMAIQNVFVYLKGVEGKFDPPAEAALLDQNGCMYKPHVQGIVKGQEFIIRNSDSTMHNVHFLGGGNKEFNNGQPTKGDLKKNFRRTQEGGKFKCDVHPWMSAYIHVLDHPFFAVSDKKGNFTIKGAPAGDYTLVAWHEKLGTVEQKITVGDGATEVSVGLSD